jgi:(2Fe-2S) ferredoxin
MHLAHDLLKYFENRINGPDITVELCGCMDMCDTSPNVRVRLENGEIQVYNSVDFAQADKIIQQLSS